MSQTERVEATMTEEDKAFLQAAAKLADMSLSRYMLNRARTAARKELTEKAPT